jgi:hypothetical protein
MTTIATSGLDGAGLDRSGQIAPSGRSGLLVVGLVALGFWLTPGFAMAGGALQVTNARVPASDERSVMNSRRFMFLPVCTLVQRVFKQEPRPS